MLHLICKNIKNVNSYREKLYDESVHTGEEHYIYDFITGSEASLKPQLKSYPLSNLLIKINNFVHRNSWSQRYYYYNA